MKSISFILILSVLAVSAVTAFSQQQKPDWYQLHPGGLGTHADFGSAVTLFSLSEDSNIQIIAVGAQNDKNQTGGVFLYKVDTTATGAGEKKPVFWQEILPYDPTHTLSGANFGCAFAFSPSPSGTDFDASLFIGSQYEANHEGVVWEYRVSHKAKDIRFHRIHRRPATTMKDQPRFFGGAMSSSEVTGDMLVIGAASGNTSGAVFVYERNYQSGDFEHTHVLQSQDEFVVGDNFGQSVAIDENGHVGVGMDHYNNLKGGIAMYLSLRKEDAREKYINKCDVVVDTPAIAKAYMGSQIEVVASPEGKDTTTLIASAPWSDYGGQVYVFVITTSKKFKLVQTLEFPPQPKVSEHTFGCSLSVNVAQQKDYKKMPTKYSLFVGDWSAENSGRVDVYSLAPFSSNQSSVFKATFEKRLNGGVSENVEAFFGASTSSVFDSKTNTSSVVVGAFSMFDDQGAAFFSPDV